MNRIDERDAMFSRMELKPGSKEYDDYYKRNPEKKDRDDELRNKPQLLGEGTMTYHPVNSTLPNSVFRFLGDIKQFSEGPVADRKVELTPEAITKKLKLELLLIFLRS